MQSSKRTSGFCSSCQKNVPHLRWIHSPILLIFDLLSFSLARLIRFGPWYCVHCKNKRTFLPLHKPPGIDYCSTVSPKEETQPSNFGPKATTSEAQSTNSTTPASPPISTPPPMPAPLQPAESVGNFIKTDSSLLMKSTRLQRYSEKYRDAVVRRILSGAISLQQARKEKQLSESEIIDWICDLVDRQQQKIETLELFKKSIVQSDLLGGEFIQDLADSKSVVGQVRPR